MVQEHSEDEERRGIQEEAHLHRSSAANIKNVRSLSLRVPYASRVLRARNYYYETHAVVLR